MINLTMEEKREIFKILFLSKVVYLALSTVVSNNFINELAKIQIKFI